MLEGRRADVAMAGYDDGGSFRYGLDVHDEQERLEVE